VSVTLDEFRRSQPFPLDAFQLKACESLNKGRGVLVAAPTGAGKTIIADYAVYLSQQTMTDKTFYTTPMKALSNQKFQDLQAIYGVDEVGLLTGDTSINPTARIVIMTTEVLRNMLYAQSDLLKDLRFVVMDEVHYLADKFRGPVWEEVILHLPQDVSIVSLSATVSNAEEFGEWLAAVRGHTDIIVSEDRPVPLFQHVYARGELYELFEPGGEFQNPPRIHRDVQGLGRGQQRFGGNNGGGHGRRSFPRNRARPGDTRERRSAPVDIASVLDDHTMLPAIFFIFSRKGCDNAVRDVLFSGEVLTTVEERDEIRSVIENRTAHLSGDDLSSLGFHEWEDSLMAGVASHHAGLIPVFKEIVEHLFRRKLVKLVFATETLALGINMPARSVVLEKLDKYNGESRVAITPGEYTQLTGRAGRRGIDVEGHSVIVWRDGMNPHALGMLASRRSYPLYSSFVPTYNMAVNLIERYGRNAARDILEQSFAPFQADRAVDDLSVLPACRCRASRPRPPQGGCSGSSRPSDRWCRRARVGRRARHVAPLCERLAKFHLDGEGAKLGHVARPRERHPPLPQRRTEQLVVPPFWRLQPEIAHSDLGLHLFSPGTPAALAQRDELQLASAPFKVLLGESGAQLELKGGLPFVRPRPLDYCRLDRGWIGADLVFRPVEATVHLARRAVLDGGTHQGQLELICAQMRVRHGGRARSRSRSGGRSRRHAGSRDGRRAGSCRGSRHRRRASAHDSACSCAGTWLIDLRL
jgi:hypothetical protein